MVAIDEQGYLENDYLEEDYLTGQVQNSFGFQATMVINDQKNVGMQALQNILDFPEPVGMQAQQIIVDQFEAYGMQALQIINELYPIGMQALMETDGNEAVGMQAQQVINEALAYGMQALMEINADDPIGMQALQVINALTAYGMQAVQLLQNQPVAIGFEARHDTLRHAIVGQYLREGDGYLEESYLVDCMGAFMGMQAFMSINQETPIGMQAQQVIDTANAYGMQAFMHIVDELYPVGMQTDQIRKVLIGMQATMVIYNTLKIRIMYEFPSRGTPALGGNNWTASSQETGDFSPNNLNTDIVEQRYQSAAGTAALTTLTCDTGLIQGVPVDTIAILGHNLTKSAQVQVQGSKDNFATTDIVFNMFVELNNMYYIAPTFPTLAGQNRQWRFVIQDETNPDDCIKIGVIVFGASHMFSVKDCFVNPIVKGFTHFKDVIPTEGFTNQSNDRALKKKMKLTFEKLTYFNGNFRLLEDYYLFCRTSLKALIIPTPQFPSRFALFAKLVEMPEETHNSISSDTEYIDLDLNWDESL